MTDLWPARAKWGVSLTALLAAAFLTACEKPLEAQVPSQQSGKPVLLAATSSAEAGSFQIARSPYGNYLAGRHADRQRDLSAAADYMLRALELDPDNLQILARAFALAAGNGRHEQAVDLARRLIEKRPEHGTARLVLAVEAIVQGDFPGAESQIAAMPKDGMAEVVAGMAGSWVALGRGDRDLALKRVERLKSLNGFDAIYNLQHTLHFV